MTGLAATLIATGVQSGLIVLLAADKWVHRLTGPTSLEGRIKALEDRLNAGDERASKKASELTVYLDARRQVVDDFCQRVSAIEGELRGMRNQHLDGSLVDERRHRERRQP